MKYHIVRITVSCKKPGDNCNYSKACNLSCPFCIGPCTTKSAMQKCVLIRSVLKSIRRGLIAEKQCWSSSFWSRADDSWNCSLRLAIPEEESLARIKSVLSMLVIKVPELSIAVDPELREITSTLRNAGFTLTESKYYPFRKILR